MNLLVSLAITTSIVAAGDVTDNTEFAGDAVTSFLLWRHAAALRQTERQTHTEWIHYFLRTVCWLGGVNNRNKNR